MKAVILGAGEGMRMRPLTSNRPKPMIPLANKPILEHLVMQVLGAGISEFVFIVGYKSGVIREYFGDGHRWKANICYKEQVNSAGTADALSLARDLVDGKFLVINGDVILQKEDLVKLASAEHTTICVKEVDDITGLGVILASGNKVDQIFEKPGSHVSKLANTGAYLLTEQVFSAIQDTEKSPRGQFELTRSLGIMIERGIRIDCQPIKYWLNLSYPWDLLPANEALLTNIDNRWDGFIEEGVHIKGPCAIGANTHVHSGSYIIGPVIIGENCDIGPNCYIRPSTAIGDGCQIGAAVEIKNSIIMTKTKIPHQSYVGDSIIGERCNLGAGTKIANLRFDHLNVRIGNIDSGRRKLGAIIGDNVQTGINATINAGTVIGSDALIWPGVSVYGRVEGGARVLKSN